MFYSVNLPDGELKRSYNEILNEREEARNPEKNWNERKPISKEKTTFKC